MSCVVDYSFAPQDPDQVCGFRQQDLKEASCTSLLIDLGSLCSSFMFLSVVFVGKGYRAAAKNNAKGDFWPGDVSVWP